MKNYKKLLVLSVSALMVFGIASCDKPTPSESVTPSTQPSISDTTVTEENFALKAAEFVFAGMKDTVNRMADFELPTVNVQWDGDIPTNVNMTWSLEVKEGGLDGAISLGEPVDGNYPVTVVYNADFSTKATEFVLKCKFVDANGNEAEIELPGVVPAFKYATYAEFEKAVKEESKEVLNVLGTVTAVYKSGPFIVDENGYGFYAYAPTGVSGQAELFAAYPVGSKVLVSGTATSYNGQSEFAKGCTVKLVEAAPANYEIPYADKTAEFASAVSTKDAAALGELQNTVVELKDVTIQDKDLTNYYYYFTVGESDVKFYLRTSGSYNDFTNDAVNEIVEEWVAGYKANLKGLVQVYNHAYYLTPIELDNAVEITERALSDEQIIVNGITEIDGTIKDSYEEAAEINLPATDASGVTYTYTVKEGSAGIAISDGKLVVTQGDAEQKGTLVVKGTLNGVEKEVEIAITVAPAGLVITPNADAIAAADGTKVNVQGTIISIAEEWSSYNNMSYTIKDAAGTEFYIFRSSTQVSLGDEVIVSGEVGSYNNAKQLAKGSTAVVLAYDKMSTISEVLAAADNTEVYVMGTVKEINTEWSTEHNNMTITIEDALGNELYVYRTKAQVNVGDNVILKGVSSSYNGAKQLAAGSVKMTLEEYKAYLESLVTPPPANLTKYTMSNYEAGVQYAENEVHVLDENTTVVTTGAHFTSEIRLYDSATTDGVAVIQSAKDVEAIVVNAGNKAGTLTVFGSLDEGATWTKIEDVAVTATYTEYTIDFGDVNYNYIKLDSTGLSQIRVKDFSLLFASSESTAVVHDMDFSSLTSTALTEPTTVDYFTFTTGVKAESIKQENASYAADEVTFEKQVSLTTGKVAVADGVASNSISFTVEEGKTATVTVYAAAKSGKTVSLKVLDAAGEAVTVSNLTKDGVALDAFDTLATENNSVAKYVFTLTAGTYHLGGSGGGAYVYDVLVSLA